ncbi:MAG: hypothetical protein H6816_14945 [Phycisphaerales bacterium]|nr:hypothetical protein [Phycisphaerales bacterium]
MQRTAFLLVACGTFAAARVQAEQFVFTPPTADRWHYGFNSTPGSRPIGSTFMAPGSVGINSDFNDRDAFVILAWDTSGVITPGQPLESYNISSIGLTVTCAPGGQWVPDATVDEWYTYDLNGDGMINADGIPRGAPGDSDGESSDPDPGRTIDIYGVGFGPTYTAATWTEGSAYIGSMYSGFPYFGDPVAARDPFPFVFQDGSLDMLHVEDHIRGLQNDMLANPVYEFTPHPWAIGDVVGYTPGSQTVPFDVHFSIDLSLSAGAVKQYFQEQLAAGKIFIIVSAAHETVMMGGQESYPNIYMREAVGSITGAKAAVLNLDLAAVPGDYDGDGDADLADFAAFPNCLTGPVDEYTDPDCAPFDFDTDGDVDLSDFASFQGVLGQ